jgi:hypothetical protein
MVTEIAMVEISVPLIRQEFRVMADQIPEKGRGRQSALSFVTSHWLSILGAALVTIAACSWLLLLTLHMGGRAANPYLGLLIFMAIPVVFFTGLALIPVGAYLARRRIAAGLAAAPDRRVVLRRLAIFFGVMTVVNVIIGSQVSYRAVTHMESNQFCGQSCHVMEPQFVAYGRSPHRNVACVECHVVPGAAGFLAAKMNGTQQMLKVMMGTYPKPVPPALQSGRLVSSDETCEQCHARGVENGFRLRVLSKFKNDEANTRVETILLANVGGGLTGGIHGAHMAPGVEIRYRATDARRSNVPWVEYHNGRTGETRTYIASGTKDSSGETLVMQCSDCHNRPGHAFVLPEPAVDAAMAEGRIPASLPFAHKTAIQILEAPYAGDDDAAKKIPAAFTGFYRQNYAALSASQPQGDIDRAGQALAEIYRENVFGDLGVKWGSYPDNLGHTGDAAGCFRCHDDSHATTAGKTISQDCDECHQRLAVDEPAPAILKTLGLSPTPAKP